MSTIFEMRKRLSPGNHQDFLMSLFLKHYKDNEIFLGISPKGVFYPPKRHHQRNILQNAAISVLSQAQQQPQLILSLLT